MIDCNWHAFFRFWDGMDQKAMIYYDILYPILDQRPLLPEEGASSGVGYAVGYVHAKLKVARLLRALFSEADEKCIR